jgi:hypothetical protein
VSAPAPTFDLRRLYRLFQGVFACNVGTCSKDGTPNSAYLSHMQQVDDRHVALSCQFFNKTSRNLAENPWAVVETFDPLTFMPYLFKLRYVRSETSGPVFDAMSLRIDAIASMVHQVGVFKLRSADVFEVLDVQTVEGYLKPGEGGRGANDQAAHRDDIANLPGLQAVSQALAAASSLDSLLEALFLSLAENFGFRHAMVLVPDGTGERLVTLGSAGYGEAGVGAEVSLDQGVIGQAARQRRPVHVTGVGQALRYNRSMAHREGFAPAEIPLPGLERPESQLALPLVLQGRLIGVLFLESPLQLAFTAWDETLLGVLANQVATSMDRFAHTEVEADEPTTVAASTPSAEVGRKARAFTLFRSDDCVFVDGEYLIRNVPGLILWKLLRAYERGQREFSNRELRLDASLKLPELKDNLESRLILLRKRLEVQCPEVKIVPVKRGRFALEVRCQVTLAEQD